MQRGEGDVVQDPKVGIEVEGLGHEADVRPKGVDVHFGVRDGNAVHEDLPRLDALESVDGPHEGALSRAARADEGEHLERGMSRETSFSTSRVAETLGHVADGDHDVVHGRNSFFRG